jgi:hypothetical protein
MCRRDAWSDAGLGEQAGNWERLKEKQKMSRPAPQTVVEILDLVTAWRGDVELEKG